MTIYLYKKTHKITGLKYLGKTKRDPYIYQGSGTYWKRHVKEHGNSIETEIIKECLTENELKHWGAYYSTLWNIVDSKEWANFKPENGDGGSNKGHTKNRIKPAWNKGYSKEELELRRNGLLLFIPLDIPKRKRKYIPKQHITKSKKIKTTIKCVVCNTETFNKVTCSRSCSAKHVWNLGKGKPNFIKNKQAWNKGIPNPLAANNGKKGKDKLSKSVLGRKLAQREDGTRYWTYPNK